MPVAEIIAIGTELLLGEIQDTNTNYLARALRDVGIDLFRATIVGDNPNRIAGIIREALSRVDIVLTAGGLGPTVDDPTRQSVAMAIDQELIFDEVLWTQIQDRFQRYGRQPTENNRRQAYIPRGAVPIENEFGTAPCFRVDIGTKTIISLPGVPREMEYILNNSIIPQLKEKYHLKGIIKAHVIHAAGVGESQVDEWVGDLEQLTNPTVGLLAHSGQIDIRVTAKANSEEEADQLIKPVAEIVRQRLGNHVYGEGDKSLLQVVMNQLNDQKLILTIHEFGFNHFSHLPTAEPYFFPIHSHPDAINMEDLKLFCHQAFPRNASTVLLAASLQYLEDRQALNIVIISPNTTVSTYKSYGGPPLLAPTWAVNMSLDYCRRHLLSMNLQESTNQG